MKLSIYDSRLIIFTGLLGLAVALADLLLYNPKVINHWFSFLHWWGKAGVMLFFGMLFWLFISTLIKGKF
jgi:hypothetical protein